MRFPLLCFFLLTLTACVHKPDANTLFAQLKDGEAQCAIQLGSAAFYPDNSRFKGEVTVAPDRFRFNVTDQYESNVIITLDTQGLFDKKPVQRQIDLDNQTAGSVLIGRIRDKAQRTGEGFVMTDGTLTIESLSDERVVIRVVGRAGNFNTLMDSTTYQPLYGLLVYRRPTIKMPSTAVPGTDAPPDSGGIHVPADLKKTLLY